MIWQYGGVSFETAQAAYGELIKTKISPEFRDRGWKGSGGRYEYPSDENWILVGFQKSAFSDRDGLRFAVNLVFASKVNWEIEKESWGGREKPPTGTYLGDAGAHARLEMLASERNVDEWWRISPGSDLAQTASDVMGKFDRFGTEWITQQG
jgi:hypothetical protein